MARIGNRGKREFIQALRLPEVFPETLVAAAALDAIRLGAISFDAVKWTCLEKVESFPWMKGELDDEAEGIYARV